MFIAAVVRQAARPISDPDSFWHLRLGSDVWTAKSVGQPDWSTSDDRPFVLTQWLPEVIASRFESAFGLAGVAWLFGLSLVVLVVIIYQTCRRSAGLTAAAFTVALCTVGMSASLSPRPHMVTYILLAVTVVAWLRTADDLRARWWLVPLTWVWACSHGMWFTGPLVGIAVVLGLALDRRVDRRTLLHFAALPVASICAAAITPVGPALLEAPFAVSGISAFITEWQAPSFRAIGPGATALMLALIVLTWARQTERVPWTRLLLLLMATGWTLLAVRTVTLGAIIAAPLLAAAIQSWLGRSREAGSRREATVLLGAVVASLAVLAMVVPHVAAKPAGMPSGINDELRALPSGTPVLNDYASGGWLRWAHPNVDPLIDGFTEAYSLGELHDYATMNAAAAGWREAVRTTGARHALLVEDSPLATALQERLSWDLITADAGRVYLVAP
ncbi:hypothetical protein ASD66_20225 [Nocardioides sp. Root151]|nr:hypothetical protein ASD66_20225 [Nocardioides sp. Root151]